MIILVVKQSSKGVDFHGRHNPCGLHTDFVAVIDINTKHVRMLGNRTAKLTSFLTLAGYIGYQKAGFIQ